MSADNKIIINQEGRDLALMFALANTAVNQTVLQALYAKVFEYSPEEAEAHLAEIRKNAFTDVCAVLAKHGNLDLPTLLESLGLHMDDARTAKPKEE